MNNKISGFIADFTLVNRLVISGIAVNKRMAEEGYDALLRPVTQS
jgi:hypothetical protein